MSHEDDLERPKDGKNIINKPKTVALPNFACYRIPLLFNYLQVRGEEVPQSSEVGATDSRLLVTVAVDAPARYQQEHNLSGAIY
jgi:hypothetical protein